MFEDFQVIFFASWTSVNPFNLTDVKRFSGKIVCQLFIKPLIIMGVYLKAPMILYIYTIVLLCFKGLSLSNVRMLIHDGNQLGYFSCIFLWIFRIIQFMFLRIFRILQFMFLRIFMIFQLHISKDFQDLSVYTYKDFQDILVYIIYFNISFLFEYIFKDMIIKISYSSILLGMIIMIIKIFQLCISQDIIKKIARITVEKLQLLVRIFQFPFSQDMKNCIFIYIFELTIQINTNIAALD